ncbi:MAG: hypothetical protein PHC88_13890 [Terrimicrobiaceae bacterium]|nr:hypothetical protein [Terrimicrobiaceae bacterium]
MPNAYQNYFSLPLDEDLAIEVGYDMCHGRPMPFVVRLMAQVAGKKFCVSRFDSAHPDEPPHRDVLGLREGLRGKISHPKLDYRDAVSYAVLDFKKHGQTYFKDFLRH